MTAATFQAGIQKIQTVTGKKVQTKPIAGAGESEADILFQKLKWLRDSSFLQIVDEYIVELSPPRGILGYFVSRANEIQIQPTKIATPQDLPLSKTDSKMLQDLTALYYENISKIPNADSWLSRLYSKWNTLPASELQFFLKNKRKDLERIIHEKQSQTS